MNVKRQKIHDQIFRWCCLVLVFCIPIHWKMIPSIIFLMVLNWLAEAKFRKIPSVFRDRHRVLTLSFSALYLFYMIGMLYSGNMDYGFFDLQVKLSLMLFPVIFSTVDKDFPLQRMITEVFMAFIAGCVTGTLVLSGIALYSYAGSRDPAVFFYTHFSKFIHPSYLSMYLNLAVSILAYFLIRKDLPLTNARRFLMVVLLFWFSLMIFLLSSKAGIFSLLFQSLMIIVYFLVIHKQVWKTLLLFFMALVMFYAAFSFLPSTADRFKRTESALSEQKRSSSEQMESNSERLVVWKAGFEVIRKHPVFGVGTGDVKDALLEEYRKENKLLVYNMRLNAHNQYLQTYIALGILGVLLLISILVLPGWMAFRRIHFVYFSFLTLFAFNILVESMLEVQAGVVYYAFFNALLFSGWDNRHDQPGDPGSTKKTGTQPCTRLEI
jgi:O-antigen ligase